MKGFTIIQIVIAIVGIGGIIAWHEFGHYLLARLLGMRVLRFSIGLGPELIGTTRNDIRYQLAWLPFGGFVQVAGMTPLDEEARDDPRAYINQPRWKRFVFLAAGPGFNYAMAIVLFFAVLKFFPGGVVVIEDVVAGSAAESAGIFPGDRIFAMNGKGFRSEADFSARITEAPLAMSVARDKLTSLRVLGERVTELNDDENSAPEEAARYLALVEKAQTFSETAESLDVEVVPRVVDGRAMLGVRYSYSSEDGIQSASVVDAATYAVVLAVSESLRILAAFGQKLRGSDDVKFSGPYEMTKTVAKAAAKGARDLLWLLGILSVAIGLLNLLPFPALDGSKMYVLVVEGLLRRDLNPTLQMAVHALGLIGFLVLMVYLTVSELLA